MGTACRFSLQPRAIAPGDASFRWNNKVIRSATPPSDSRAWPAAPARRRRALPRRNNERIRSGTIWSQLSRFISRLLQLHDGEDRRRKAIPLVGFDVQMLSAVFG